jgi:hypothetical protein
MGHEEEMGHEAPLHETVTSPLSSTTCASPAETCTVATQWDPTDFAQDVDDLIANTLQEPLHRSSPIILENSNSVTTTDTEEDTLNQHIDTSFNPSLASVETSFEDSFLKEDDNTPDKEQKFIVFQSCLESLFKRSCCPDCGQAINIHNTHINGTLLTISYTCLNGHENKWASQPTVKHPTLGSKSTLSQ